MFCMLRWAKTTEAQEPVLALASQRGPEAEEMLMDELNLSE